MVEASGDRAAKGNPAADTSYNQDTTLKAFQAYT